MSILTTKRRNLIAVLAVGLVAGAVSAARAADVNLSVPAHRAPVRPPAV